MLENDGKRGVVVVGFGGDAHAFGQQASPAAWGMVLKVEFAGAQGGVMLGDQFPHGVREPFAQLRLQPFRACARTDEQTVGRIVGKQALQCLLQLLQRNHCAIQYAPLAICPLGEGNPYLVAARVNR
jgi:hypothetical protein